MTARWQVWALGGVQAAQKARASLLAVLVGMAVGAAVVAAYGENPFTVYSSLFQGAFDRYGLPNTLSRAVPVVGAGLAAAVAFRAGFFTLGVEGQMVLGGLAGALVAIHLPSGAGALALPAAILAAMVIGAMWSLLAAWFELRFAVPILLGTLLMNYPATLFASYLVSGPLGDRVGGVSQTAQVPDAVRLGELAAGTRLNVGALAILVIVVALAYALSRTSGGYEVRMTGLNANFSRYGGVEVRRVGYKVMLASGLIAGLVGAIQVLGVHYRFIDGALTAPLYAWVGLMAALLAESNPLGVLVAGLFFAALQTGGLEVERTTDLTRELSLILQSTIIILVASRYVFRARQRWRTRERTPAQAFEETR
jgi:general nucleoside transport system permease protein